MVTVFKPCSTRKSSGERDNLTDKGKKNKINIENYSSTLVSLAVGIGSHVSRLTKIFV